MFEDDLAFHMSHFPDLEVLLGGRVYPQVLPEHPTLPAMVFSEVSRVPSYSHSGDSGLDEAVFQFSCWGNSPRIAKQVADGLRAALRVPLYWQAAFIDNRFSRDDPETGLSREIVMVRFQIGVA